MIFSIIVTSARPRTGKTLVGRLLVEHFLLAGAHPEIYDTDAPDGSLALCYPEDSRIIDLNRVPDQVGLFDALTRPGLRPRIVDIAHHGAKKIVTLMRESNFVGEARAQKIEPVIVYVAATDPESFELGRQLRAEFDCPFVLVENAHLGPVSAFTQESSGYRALRIARPRVTITELEPAHMKLIEHPAIPWNRMMRETTTELTFVQHEAIKRWLLRSFRQVHHALHNLEELYAVQPARQGSGG
jgi:hypothetical protein